MSRKNVACGIVARTSALRSAPLGHAVVCCIALLCPALLGMTATWTAAHAQSSGGGESAFVAYGCYQCHGYEGQGGVAGPRIGPSPYPFVAFAQFVRRPVNVMPAYAPDVLSEEALRTIYDYVRTRPEPPDADTIRLLQ